MLPSTGKKVAAVWAETGVVELGDVPVNSLANPLHARVHNVPCTGIPFLDAEGARNATENWTYPRTYLDFETIAFVVPRWIGTRPYEQAPFQFSAHIEQADRSLSHNEFLSLDGSDPRRVCAEALVELPRTGAIIAYSAGFERGCVNRLADLFPDLADGLRQISARIVDLLPVTRNFWYHRDQRGSWSLKAVLPTVAKHMDYKNLAVQDGSAAQSAYLEAIRPETSDWRRQEIDRDLRIYCGQDTKAMVELLHHLSKT